MGYVHKAYTRDYPAGIEDLGTATAGIIDAMALYGGARKGDTGQRLPTKLYDDNIDYPRPDEKFVCHPGKDSLESYYLKKSQKNNKGHSRTHKEEYEFRRRK